MIEDSPRHIATLTALEPGGQRPCGWVCFIRVVDHHLGKFFSTVGYDRTLEILCQRSVKWFL